LIAGGLSQGNLDILINAAASPVSSPQRCENLSQKAIQYSADAHVFVPRANVFHTTFHDKRGVNFSKAGPNCNGVPPTPPSLRSELHEDEVEEKEAEASCEEQEHYINNYEDRSVTLRGLSPHTTLADIAKVVRGGLVLNMFIRPRERTAHVAFVDPIAAEKFLIHSKRSDIYIKGKRVCNKDPFSMP
jgi:hypothetical protein